MILMEPMIDRARRLRFLAVSGVLFFLGGTSSGCLGCAQEPAATDEGALRLRFPDHAARILESPVPFAAAVDEFTVARPGVTVHLPAKAGLAARFELAAGPAIQVREIGISGDGALAGSAVAFGRDGGRSYWTATAYGLEEWLLVDAGVATGAREIAAWDVEGGELALQDGAVVVRDPGGVARLRVAAPAAYTISGKSIEASLAVHGSRLELWADPGGEAALVDPTWTATGSLATARYYHAAALLQSGKVIVAGGTTTGVAPPPFPLNAELYDPTAGTWSPAGTISNGRAKTAAVTLAGGQVLLAGGYDGTTSYTTADLYTPATNTWSPTGAMAYSRSGTTLTLLASGEVLVTGGEDDNTGIFQINAEVYNPATAVWSPAGTYGTTGRRFHVAVRLASGQVLLAGGVDNVGDALQDAWLYSPTTNAWTQTGTMITARTNAAGVLLTNDEVLVAGGSTDTVTGLTTTELYNPTTGTWAAGPSMATPRLDHTITLLPSGEVLVTGGDTGEVSTTSTELYNPTTGTWSSAGAMITARAVHTATLLSGGDVLVAGGGEYDLSTTATATSEILAGSLALGAACTAGVDCASGNCVSGVCCNTACNGGVCSVCSVAAGAPANGTCAALNAGTCDDGNACTQTDTCQAGVCVGSNPVVCPAPDQCEVSGACSPSSGLCVYVSKANGTACNDGDACTVNDACASGVCAGTPVACPAPDGCHTTGVCALATGLCVFSTQPDGTACSDGNVCVQAETCTDGVCGGGTAIPCTALDQCHVVGVCNPVTGCSNPTATDGTTCNDGNPCTEGEVCLSGACVGGNPVTCVPTSTCQTAGTCDPTNGCVNPSAPDGTTCNDNNACTTTDVCKGGSCEGFDPVVCPTPDECHMAGTCDPTSGVCSNPAQPNGTACSTGTCFEGNCTTGGGTGGAGGSGTTTSTTGSSTTTTTGSSGTTGSGAGGAGAGDGGPELMLTPSSCTCRAAGDHEAGGGEWFGVALAVAAGLGRRRSRAPLTRRS